VNRIQITGTGKLNGVAGATVTLVLIDNGEKNGAPADQAYIEINGIALTNGSIEDPADRRRQHSGALRSAAQGQVSRCYNRL